MKSLDSSASDAESEWGVDAFYRPRPMKSFKWIT